jgi:ectoine hydroxylase-related dioxygenase (phytanoyl-CoA dioxygenase family)
VSELETPYPLRAEQIGYYRECGYVRLERVLSEETLGEYGAEITRVVREVYAERFRAQALRDYGPELVETLRRWTRAAAGRSSDTYARAFTQRTNLWRLSEKVERLVRSPRLAKLAADLMGVEGVRLYHDQALFKEPQGGHTPWHVDQFYWPLSNSNTITIWIPLQPVPAEMGPVAFGRGSQHVTESQARELAISDESEARLAELMRSLEVDGSPFALGEVSFHSGWTYHRADPNTTDRVRAAFTIIYMDRDVRMIEPKHQNHRFDAMFWLPGVEPGEVAASPMNPVLYERPGG